MVPSPNVSQNGLSKKKNVIHCTDLVLASISCRNCTPSLTQHEPDPEKMSDAEYKDSNALVHNTYLKMKGCSGNFLFHAVITCLLILALILNLVTISRQSKFTGNFIINLSICLFVPFFVCFSVGLYSSLRSFDSSFLYSFLPSFCFLPSFLPFVLPSFFLPSVLIHHGPTSTLNLTLTDNKNLRLNHYI